MATQGQGQTTRRKLDCFASLFRQSLLISRKYSLMPWPYWHIDLNAGSGWNSEVECEGSPVIFARTAREVGRCCRANFCDNGPAQIEALRPRLAEVGWPNNWTDHLIEVAENDVFLFTVARLITAEEKPQFAVGSVLSDPNGPSGLPVGSLAAFAKLFPRIDVIININASCFARIRGCKENPTTPANRAIAAKYLELYEVIKMIDRPHWHVLNNRRATGFGDRFLILVGRTLNRKKPPTPDFVSLESIAGQEIVCDLKNVPVGQQYLF